MLYVKQPGALIPSSTLQKQLNKIRGDKIQCTLLSGRKFVMGLKGQIQLHINNIQVNNMDIVNGATLNAFYSVQKNY